MITIRQKGDFHKVTGYLERMKNIIHLGILDKYGRKGVEVLKAATPIDSGETANSWYYKIEHGKDYAIIGFYNSHVNDGVSIAIILQYGHGTGTGGWVEGRDYINPSIGPLFDEIADEAWKEITKL